ncbi:MAG: hypothetical protein RLZZ58_1522, partial [Pseudomonadota bacterium]
AKAPMPVVRLWDDQLEVYRGGGSYNDAGEDSRPSDYVSCGARAFFVTLTRLPVDADMAQREWDSLRAAEE